MSLISLSQRRRPAPVSTAVTASLSIARMSWVVTIAGSVGLAASTPRAHSSVASEGSHDSASTRNVRPSAVNLCHSCMPVVSRPPNVACAAARDVGKYVLKGSLAGLPVTSWLPARIEYGRPACSSGFIASSATCHSCVWSTRSTMSPRWVTNGISSSPLFAANHFVCSMYGSVP